MSTLQGTNKKTKNGKRTAHFVVKLTREENAQLSNTFVPHAISQITLKKLAETQIPVDQVNETKLTNRRFPPASSKALIKVVISWLVLCQLILCNM